MTTASRPAVWSASFARRAIWFICHPKLGVKGQADELHLTTATNLGAAVITHNQKHFAPLHHRWDSDGRVHGGIILVLQDLDIGTKLASIDRAARLLAPQAARGQLMHLKMFETEERAQAFVASLSPP